MRSHRRRGPFIALAIIVALSLVVTVVGVVGLIEGPTRSEPSPTSSAHPSSRVPSPSTSESTTAMAVVLPTTNHAVRYARAVAEAVFSWDTMSTVTPEDITSGIVADADPSGLETPGLVADLANYLPTDEVWQELRAYSTRESLTVDSARIPADWPQIVESAGSELQTGTVAVTITGVRHRTGSWQGQAEHADSAVSFSVFVLCRPAYPDCHVLRLSQLGDPLK